MENHLCRYLIQDCMNLASETEVNLQHVLCEVNRCTDKMVKLGSKQNEKMVKILVPPMIWWIICQLPWKALPFQEGSNPRYTRVYEI